MIKLTRTVICFFLIEQKFLITVTFMGNSLSGAGIYSHHRITALRDSKTKIFKKGDQGFGILANEKKIDVRWNNGNEQKIRWPLRSTWYKHDLMSQVKCNCFQKPQDVGRGELFKNKNKKKLKQQFF
jgi:hypothetical protein